MATIYHEVEFAVERFGPEGPTGELIEVEEVALVDYGDNEICRAATAARAEQYRRSYASRPCRIKAIKPVGRPRTDLQPKMLCNF